MDVIMTDMRTSAMKWSTVLAAICALVFALAAAAPAAAKEKKQAAPAPAAKDPNKLSSKEILEKLDYSRIVWPNPPAIVRIRFVDQFFGEKRDEQQPKQQKKKQGWMDRLSGVAVGEANPNEKLYFQLVRPYGVGVDPQGKVYVADEKVRAIFIYNPENQQVELIKNGVHASFKLITGLVVDDAGKLFVSDSELKHVLVFSKDHKLETSIGQGMVRPAGLAIDNENRFLYVCDSERDQVLVFDADNYQLLRTIGKPSGKHDLTEPGSFSRPTNAAVDKDGNLYVADTFNNRIEIFDADGNFIREFGKSGDGPGYFARPKGIGIDADGHVWVADAVQDRIQVFTPEGQLLIYLGEHGLLPGQFNTLAGFTFDNKNRFFTTEQYPGRLQIFRYVTDEEAKAEKAKRDAVADNKTVPDKKGAAKAGTTTAATTPK
jgi:DNA-binding beta-propeller fold protein YncE